MPPKQAAGNLKTALAASERKPFDCTVFRLKVHDRIRAVKIFKRQTSVEVLAHLSLDSEHLHVAWRFPDSPAAPVTVAVDRRRALSWTERLSELGLRGRGNSGAGVNDRRDLRASPMPGDPDAELRKLGGDIYAAIFPHEVEERWNQAVGGQGDRVVHVVFQWDSTLCEKGLDPALIPFEAMLRPGSGAGRLERVTADLVLASHVSIERRITDYRGMGPAFAPQRLGLKVLVFTAPINLGDKARKEEEKESQCVRRCLEKAGRGKGIRTTVVSSGAAVPATWEAFCEGVRGQDVVHFIGHGRIENGVGELLFETPGGGASWISMAQVALALKNAGVKLLILNCCETVSFSSYACMFPAVVGHQYAVTGQSVERFEGALFQSLLASGSIEEAVWAGRQAIWRSAKETSWEYRTPVLYLQARKQRDSRLITLSALAFSAAVGMAALFGYQQWGRPAVIETDIVVSVTERIDGRAVSAGASGAAISRVFAGAGYGVEVDDEARTGPAALEQLSRRYRFKHAVLGTVTATSIGTELQAGTIQHKYVGEADLRLTDSAGKSDIAPPVERDVRWTQSPADAARKSIEAVATQAATHLVAKLPSMKRPSSGPSERDQKK